MRQRLALAAALDRGTDPQLTRTCRCQRHLRPLERQQQRRIRTAVEIGTRNRIEAQHMQRAVQQRRMQAVTLRRFRQRLRQDRPAVHRIGNPPRLAEPLKR